MLADGNENGTEEIYAPSTNGLGILVWEHVKDCSFRAVASGLPDRDVWYGLALGPVRSGGGEELIAAGYAGGIRVFAPSHAVTGPGGTGSLLVQAPEDAREQWANGNDVFTTALGFDEYRLGVGDLVRLRVFNGVDVQEVEADVQSDGQIFVPVRGVGSVEAAGFSPTQLKRTLLGRAREVWVEPEVEVVVVKYRAHKIALLGEVRTTARVDSGPGQYPLEGKTRAVDFLSKHGGPTERADLNRVQLIRPSGRSSYLNLYKAIFASDRRENPILNNGDTLFVPSVALSNRKVFVLGEVRQPGLMELRENITLLEAVARAEGFTQKAVLKQVLVIRGGLTSPELIAVNIKDLLERGDMSSDLVLRNGDVVYVPRRVVADVKEAFSAIQPALNLIEDIFIIRELTKDD
jgi:polysaccharide export outer membrane protein